MAKKRFTNVPEYYREGHYTSGHKRQLKDSGMMLELAEGGDSFSNYLQFILLPDPTGRSAPRFIREDQFAIFNNDQFNKILNYVAPVNSKKLLRSIVSRRADVRAFLRDEYGNDGSGITAEEVSGWVNLGLDLYNLFFGDGSSSGSGGGSPSVSLIGTNGFLYALKNIGGNNTGFGIAPDGSQLIAFSSPDEAKKYFPQWDQFTNVPQLPPSVPNALIMKALQNPNRIVNNTFTTGSGGSGSGNSGSGGSGSGSGSAILGGIGFPLLLIGGLAYLGLKK